MSNCRGSPSPALSAAAAAAAAESAAAAAAAAAAGSTAAGITTGSSRGSSTGAGSSAAAGSGACTSGCSGSGMLPGSTPAEQKHIHTGSASWSRALHIQAPSTRAQTHTARNALLTAHEESPTRTVITTKTATDLSPMNPHHSILQHSQLQTQQARD
ncbi:hypothetical protein COO60DRAFT_40634 [Scenedesmus sp. NREL 46B-D3]|nr:hypothetical protein COO60DRAFT_40634 [Scenedesmus sp. NREL 46B-D3]